MGICFFGTPKGTRTPDLLIRRHGRRREEVGKVRFQFVKQGKATKSVGLEFGSSERIVSVCNKLATRSENREGDFSVFMRCGLIWNPWMAYAA